MATDEILPYQRKMAFRLRYPRCGLIIVILPLLCPFCFYLMPDRLLLHENIAMLMSWCLCVLFLLIFGIMLLIRHRHEFKPRILSDTITSCYFVCCGMLTVLAYRDVFSSYTANDSFIVQCKKTAFALYTEAEGHNGVFPISLKSEVLAGRMDAEQLYHPFHLSRNISRMDPDIIYLADSLIISKQVDWGKIVIFESRDLFWNHAKIIGYADGSCEVAASAKGALKNNLINWFHRGESV